jgi:hypothetical protein
MCIVDWCAFVMCLHRFPTARSNRPHLDAYHFIVLPTNWNILVRYPLTIITCLLLRCHSVLINHHHTNTANAHRA